MSLRTSWIWMIAITLLLSLGVNPTPTLAGRYVLNQTPETIEQSFGRYWTKLTQTDAQGQKSVTYTYSPTSVRRVLPEYPFSTLSMRYVNDKVQSVTVRPYRTAQEQQRDEVKAEDNAMTYRTVEAKLFEALFGYRPSITMPLYLSTGIFYSYIDCLGDGVASSYSIHHGAKLSDGITLAYNSACEPPYDRIQFKQEKGPSGG